MIAQCLVLTKSLTTFRRHHGTRLNVVCCNSKFGRLYSERARQVGEILLRSCAGFVGIRGKEAAQEPDVDYSPCWTRLHVWKGRTTDSHRQRRSCPQRTLEYLVSLREWRLLLEQEVVHNDVETTQFCDGILHQYGELVRVREIRHVACYAFYRRKVLHDAAVARIGRDDGRAVLDQRSGYCLADAISCIENQCIESV